MDSKHIEQDGNHIVITSKSIDWLVNYTSVSVFDPISFQGYQRHIDENHCLKIVNYLKSSCFLPSAIICACEDYSDDSNLRIVDGQHRVEAFKILFQKERMRYEQIKNIEIPVVVLVNVPVETEINTFITINKTSKKVDTSLAYVLKNQLSKGGGDMVMSRSEYIAVEVAQRLNECESDRLWSNQILYEGNVKKSKSFISLNAFVRATRVLVNTLNQIGYVNLNWSPKTKQEEVFEIVKKTTELVHFIWFLVYQHWPEMLEAPFDDKQILQGAIGYTAITRTIVKLIKNDGIMADELRGFIANTIRSFDIPYTQWTREGTFSNYSSEAGYKIVSETLIENMRNIKENY